jgi:hypothetical protein
MRQTDPDDTLASPTLRRVLAVAWVGIVVIVGACIFLGTWWSLQALPEESAGPTGSPTLAGAALSPDTSGQPAGPPAGAESSPDRSFGYGIVVQAAVNTEQTYDQVQQMDLGWVRQPVRWADIEPQPGDLRWDLLDPIFIGAAARGLKVLVTVTAAPDWARSITATGFEGPPDDARAYAIFLSLLLRRYQGAIQAVEIWGEMNRDTAWYTPGGLSPSGYMELLSVSAGVIRGVDPGIIIVSGGLAPTGIDDGLTAVDDFRYLRELIQAGMLDQVDCVGVRHQGYNLGPDVPYDAVADDPTALFREPYENPHHSWSFYSTLRGYHDLVAAAGRSTPLCITEFGWASIGGLPRTTVPDFVYDNTLEEQARYTGQAFRLMQEWGFVWMAFLSNLDYAPEAVGSPPESLVIYYRVVRPDGEPRPVFETVQAMEKLP